MGRYCSSFGGCCQKSPGQKSPSISDTFSMCSTAKRASLLSHGTLDTSPAVFEYQKLPKVLIMPMQVSWPGDTPPPASAEPTDETSNTETTEEPESSGEEETSETETIEEAYTFVFKGLDIRKATYAELQNAFLNTYQMEDVVCRRCIKLFTELSADAGIPLSLQLEHR